MAEEMIVRSGGTQGVHGNVGGEGIGEVRPSLSSSDHNAILSQLQHEKWDDNRLPLLDQVGDRAVTTDQALAFLNAFKWDDGKAQALRTLAPNLVGEDHSALVGAFKWGDGKQEAADILGVAPESQDRSSFTPGTIRTTINGVTTERAAEPNADGEIVGLDLSNLDWNELGKRGPIRVETNVGTVGPGQSVVGVRLGSIG